MRVIGSLLIVVSVVSVVAVAACHGTPAPQPTPAARPRRRPPDPRVQDSIRRAAVAGVAMQIAGKENLPAAQVFKNVEVLKDIPAGELLRTMDETYGRGLGWVCSNCHVPDHYDSDQRKNKRIARQMQQMTDAINAQQLPNMKELDEDYKKVSCVTCHRGSNSPPNRMPQPTAPPAPQSR